MPRRAIENLILLALPASGKSEVRKFLGGMDPELRLQDFGIGHTLDLDDYPYVHSMRRMDEELAQRERRPAFYLGRDRPFKDSITWSVLIELLNEDHEHLRSGRPYELASKYQSWVRWFLRRVDKTRNRLGMHPLFSGPESSFFGFEHGTGLNEEIQRHADSLNGIFAANKEGATVVMEFARGGPHGSSFPIIPPRGYASALQTLDPAILETARILYIKVTPEQARQKNIERGQPSEQGSILFHSVPSEVMLADYGCDDIEWLMGQSDRPNTIRVERVVQEEDRFVVRVYYVPVAIFDNREDLTSFVREPKELWAIEDIRALQDGLASAMVPLLALD